MQEPSDYEPRNAIKDINGKWIEFTSYISTKSYQLAVGIAAGLLLLEITDKKVTILSSNFSISGLVRVLIFAIIFIGINILASGLHALALYLDCCRIENSSCENKSSYNKALAYLEKRKCIYGSFSEYSYLTIFWLRFTFPICLFIIYQNDFGNDSILPLIFLCFSIVAAYIQVQFSKKIKLKMK